MQCDRCGKPSVYRSTYIINGVSQTTNLCRDCAIKEGVFNSNSLFDNMFSPFFQNLKIGSVKDVVCPVCKTSLKEFKTTGVLGCANCYNTFVEEVKEILAQISPNTTHKQETISKPKAKRQTKAEKIENLKNELKLAVQEERYEDAGKIKKQIQALEGANE